MKMAKFLGVKCHKFGIKMQKVATRRRSAATPELRIRIRLNIDPDPSKH